MGGLLSEPVTEKQSSDGNNGHLEYGSSTMQGWIEVQENSHFCSANFDEDTSLFAVFEGHGGYEVAEYCAQNFPNFLKQSNNYKLGKFEEALKDALLEFDVSLTKPDVLSKLKKLSVKHKKEADEEDKFHLPGITSGSTAVIVLLKGLDLFVANIGDTRCVLSQRGKAIAMTEDHQPSRQCEVNRIVRAGGDRTWAMKGRVEGEMRMSRALGDHRFKQNPQLCPEQQLITALPDIKGLKIKPEQDEFIILAGGVWDCLTNQEIVDFVRIRIPKNPEKLSKICEELFDHCLELEKSEDGTACENMTAIIIRFKPTLNLEERKPSKRTNTNVLDGTGTEGGKCQKVENIGSVNEKN